MKNRIENNIQYNACVSKETMIHYIMNTLDKKSFLNVSEHLENCEYCSEAFSGLKQMNDFSAVYTLASLWKEKTGLKSPSGTSAYTSKIMRGIVSLSIVITGVLFFNYNNKVIKNENPADAKKNFFPEVKTEIKEKSNIHETEINRNENKPELSPGRNESKLIMEINNEEEEIPGKIPKKEVFVLHQNYTPAMNVSTYHRSALSEIIYLENLKTINYSKTYSGSQLKLEGILNNVVAQYENREQQDKSQNELQKNTYAISYEKALSNGLRNYNKGLYPQAVNDFDIILKQFPKDLNCKFYKALCYENTGKFTEAEKLFSEITYDPDDSFFEEAKWHLATSKIKSEEISEAKNILKQIISDNGFYKSKAEIILQELK